MSAICPYCKEREYPDAPHLNQCAAEKADRKRKKHLNRAVMQPQTNKKGNK